ncbi:unnamed protein product [Leptidea sinapis]|uniref:Uncharacterized protein n=1 Tax=Leptidea sinapis TaxID=189913 RepID=A0A5E4Q8C8_9NEOP|nr:unnamed protein product [Leptidea sinapis]
MEPTHSLKRSPQGEEERESPWFSILKCAKCHDWYPTLCHRPTIGDWHCPSCQRKLNEVVEHGASQQPMEQTFNRDWDMEPTPNQSLERSPQGEGEHGASPWFSIRECAKCHLGYPSLCKSRAATELSVVSSHCPPCRFRPNEIVAPDATQQPMNQTQSLKRSPQGQGEHGAGPCFSGSSTRICCGGTTPARRPGGKQANRCNEH